MIVAGEQILDLRAFRRVGYLDFAAVMQPQEQAVLDPARQFRMGGYEVALDRVPIPSGRGERFWLGLAEALPEGITTVQRRQQDQR